MKVIPEGVHAVRPLTKRLSVILGMMSSLCTEREMCVCLFCVCVLCVLFVCVELCAPVLCVCVTWSVSWSVCVCPLVLLPRGGCDLSPGRSPARGLQPERHLHCSSRAGSSGHLLVLEPERASPAGQQQGRAGALHPGAQPGCPPRVPTALGGQPGLPRAGRTAAGWELPLRGP